MKQGGRFLLGGLLGLALGYALALLLLPSLAAEPAVRRLTPNGAARRQRKRAAEPVL